MLPIHQLKNAKVQRRKKQDRLIIMKDFYSTFHVIMIKCCKQFTSHSIIHIEVESLSQDQSELGGKPLENE